MGVNGVENDDYFHISVYGVLLMRCHITNIKQILEKSNKKINDSEKENVKRQVGIMLCYYVIL